MSPDRFRMHVLSKNACWEDVQGEGNMPDFPRLLDAEPPGPLTEVLEKYRPVLLERAEQLLHHLPWLRGKCEAADLVQETLFRAHRFHEQFRGESEEQRL